MSYTGPLAKLLVQSNSNQTCAPGSTTKVTGWQTPKFDTASAFSTGSSNYVAPATGYYSISGQLQISTAAIAQGVQLQIYLYVNGSNYQSEFGVTLVPFANAYYTSFLYNFLAAVNYSETIDIRFQGGTLNANTNTMFLQISQLA